MLVSLVPLFDENMAIRAYSVFTQKKNFFLSANMSGSVSFDGAGRVDGMEVIQSMGMETLSYDKDVFVPVTSMNLFSDIASQCEEPHERLVLLIEPAVKPEPMFIDRIKQLKDDGYKFAIRKLQVSDFQAYTEILKLMDYCLINPKKVDLAMAKRYFAALFPNITLCAVNVDTQEEFEAIKQSVDFRLYEGNFYQLPITKGEHKVAPLKVNYINLINLVNDENYDLQEAADIIGHDPSLTIDLLRMVNNIAVNSEVTSVRHAAAMLGQKELTRWITTAVVSEMCSDKPSEIMRLAMLRAKFAEVLAPAFGLGAQTSEVFLMGLFSVLDAILETTMEDALSMVNVSKNVASALLTKEGPYAELYDYIVQHEKAYWPEACRLLIIKDIDIKVIYDAYLEALVWYRKLILGK